MKMAVFCKENVSRVADFLWGAPYEEMCVLHFDILTNFFFIGPTDYSCWNSSTRWDSNRRQSHQTPRF